MFIICRKIPGKSKSRVMICQSARNGKKVVQKTIKYYGVAHSEEQREILVDQARKEIARLSTPKAKIKKYASSDGSPIDACGGALLGNMEERFRATEGFHAIFGPI